LGIEIKKICNDEDVQSFIQQKRATTSKFKISEDFKTYYDCGINVFPECNIVAGDLMARFLQSENIYIRSGEVKKRTFNDLSRFLANEIRGIVRERKPKTLLIEVGGTIEDKEQIYIPGAIRFLGNESNSAGPTLVHQAIFLSPVLAAWSSSRKYSAIIRFISPVDLIFFLATFFSSVISLPL
jgi:hypothetical protein